LKVRLADQANADLREIGRWIARDNPAGARAFSRTLRDKCLSLARFPRRHPIVGELRGFPLRKRTYRAYLIFYVITADHIEVVRVMHGSRDWERLLDSVGP